MPRGEFRLLKSVQGRMHFARVAVEAEPAPASDVAYGPREDLPDDEVPLPSWVEAARQGAVWGLQRLVPEGGTRLVMTRIQGHPADTNPDAVWCAAALAAWRALATSEVVEPKPVYEAGSWRLQTASGEYLGPNRRI